MIDESVAAASPPGSDIPAWKQVVAKYQQPSMWRSIWQITNSLVPYAVLWYLMYLSLSVSYWLTGALAIASDERLAQLYVRNAAEPVRSRLAEAAGANVMCVADRAPNDGLLATD